MALRSALRKLLAFLLALTFAVQAQARTPLDDWNRVRALAPGSEVFVKTAQGEKYKGALSCVTDRELIIYAYQHGVFRRDRYRVVLQRTDVREVRMLARELSGLAGAGIGAGAGAALGAGLDTATARDHEFRGVAALTMALLGSAIGLAIGRGTGFIKGEKIYVASPPPTQPEPAPLQLPRRDSVPQTPPLALTGNDGLNPRSVAGFNFSFPRSSSFPLCMTDSMLRVSPIFRSGRPLITSTSAGLPGSSVPRSFWYRPVAPRRGVAIVMASRFCYARPALFGLTPQGQQSSRYR